MDIVQGTLGRGPAAGSIMGRMLSYVEIKTKITSTFPFLMALAYLYASGIRIQPLKTAVFFLGMFFFDLTATTVNNYCDTKKNHQTLQFSRYTAKAILISLFIISASLGLYLVYLTDWVVLLLGSLCFLFGVMYSYGPVPISHGPYGEIVSGLFYGLLIPAILIYINMPEGMVFSYSLVGGKLTMTLGVKPMLGLLMLSIVPFCLTANIMLANNICDLKHDIAVNRYTLPYYLGDTALRLFAAIYYAAFMSVVVMVAVGFLPPLSLALMVFLIPVQKNINKFFKEQTKEDTFIVSVQNFLIVIIPHILLIYLGGFLPGWGP